MSRRTTRASSSQLTPTTSQSTSNGYSSQRSNNHRAVAVSDDSSSDSEYERKKTVPKNRRSAPVSQRLSEEEEEEDESDEDATYLVSDIVNYIFKVSDSKLPIKKQDISKNAMRGSNLTSQIIKKATDKIKDKSGLTLTFIARVNGYILIDERKNPVKYVQKSAEDGVKRGILLCILSVIYMSHGKLTSEQLWRFLRKVKITESELVNELSLTGKELLKQFKNQLYIEEKKETIGDNTKILVSWGERAMAEINKQDILVFVSRVYKCSPDSWKEAQAEANRDAAADEVVSID